MHSYYFFQGLHSSVSLQNKMAINNVFYPFMVSIDCPYLIEGFLTNIDEEEGKIDFVFSSTRRWNAILGAGNWSCEQIVRSDKKKKKTSGNSLKIQACGTPFSLITEPFIYRLITAILAEIIPNWKKTVDALLNEQQPDAFAWRLIWMAAKQGVSFQQGCCLQERFCILPSIHGCRHINVTN